MTDNATPDSSSLLAFPGVQEQLKALIRCIHNDPFAENCPACLQRLQIAEAAFALGVSVEKTQKEQDI